MIKLKAVLLLMICMPLSELAKGQEVGMSFAYFFPRNGYFSNPVAPLSIRDVGFDLGKYFSITTGVTLYRMAGMSVSGVPFEGKEPIMGVFFAPIVPLEFDVHIPANKVELLLRGGGFVFYPFASHLNYGNLDRAIMAHEDWDIANANMEFRNNLGYGYFFGSDFILKLNQHLSLALKGNYFIGTADLDLRGYYTGWSALTGSVTKDVEYPDSQLDFTGLEVGLGVSYKMR